VLLRHLIMLWRHLLGWHWTEVLVLRLGHLWQRVLSGYETSDGKGQRTMGFMEFVVLPAGLSTPTMARPMDARMRTLERRCALPAFVREAWPIVRLAYEVANDRIPAHSGKYLRYNQSRHEKGCESHVRVLVFVLWC
jgi:hypothetical protein